MSTSFLKFARYIVVFLMVLSSIQGFIFGAPDEELPSPSLESPMWPVWVHEHWVWENEGTEVSALSHAEGFTERGIPVGAIIIDRPHI